MTLQEAKDQIAFRDYLKPFDEIFLESTRLQILDEAAELYARSKWAEACEAQKQICSNLLNDWEFGGRSSVHHFKDASKPEFKI